MINFLTNCQQFARSGSGSPCQNAAPASSILHPASVLLTTMPCCILSIAYDAISLLILCTLLLLLRPPLCCSLVPYYFTLIWAPGHALEGWRVLGGWSAAFLFASLWQHYQPAFACVASYLQHVVACLRRKRRRRTLQASASQQD